MIRRSSHVANARICAFGFYCAIQARFYKEKKINLQFLKPSDLWFRIILSFAGSWRIS